MDSLVKIQWQLTYFGIGKAAALRFLATIQETHVKEASSPQRHTIHGYDMTDVKYHPQYGTATYVREDLNASSVVVDSHQSNLYAMDSGWDTIIQLVNSESCVIHLYKIIFTWVIDLWGQFGD